MLFQRRRLQFVIFLVSSASIFIVLLVYVSKSDDPELLPFLKELIPAGHCLCESSTNFECATCLDCAVSGSGIYQNKSRSDTTWQYQYGRDDQNQGLDFEQCNAAFPGLFEDIDRAGKFRHGRPVTAAEVASINLSYGMVRAMIYDGELYVLEVRCGHTDHRKKVLATLYSLYRAISANSERYGFPNAEFVFSIDDMVGSLGDISRELTHPLWVLARRSRDDNLWLMPDFGFWSWNVDGVGPYESVATEIVDREQYEPWEDKERKLVWRGKLSYAPKLRRALAGAAEGKPWSAVSGRSEDYMSPADQCTYMFIAHAEGRSYSGSLKYRQLCRSVVISHKLQWIQHHHYLLLSNGTEQNFVEVERDFSNLASTMDYLLSHPEEAKRIADNSVKTFRERYLTPAAEACYWRALFREWARISFRPKLYEGDKSFPIGAGQAQKSRRRRGVRFESFAIFDGEEQLIYP